MIKHLKFILKNMDKKLFLLTVGLFIFGLLNIVTASSREASESNMFYYFFKQLQMLTIGLAAAFIILKFPTKSYYVWGPLAFVGTLGLVIAIFLFSGEHRGAQNWLEIFGFTFQPSELAKPVIIVCLALLFESNYKKLRDRNIKHYDIIAKMLGVGLVIPLIVIFQKDLGTAFITLMIFGVMFLSSPILKREKFNIITLIIILFVVSGFALYSIKGYILSPAQMSRFQFFNPCSNYETGGYQTCNAFIAFNDGGLWGLGIGNSKQKYSYIPEPHTDSVFAIISEEYGVLKCVFIFITYIFILKRILDISSKANTTRGRYIALGVAVYIFMHIFINLGGLFGIIPLTGVPLPFLSYGGTYAICLLISLAIVQRVYIETKTQKIKVS